MIMNDLEYEKHCNIVENMTCYIRRNGFFNTGFEMWNIKYLKWSYGFYTRWEGTFEDNEGIFNQFFDDELLQMKDVKIILSP